MSKKFLSIAGVGFLSLGSAFMATPASATNANCGTAPTGGTMTSSGNVCTLTFSTPGDYTFTPSVIGDLQAIMVSGGGGAEAHGDVGYAGNGGDVYYVDLSDETAGVPIDLTVGVGGDGGPTATNGSQSQIGDVVASGGNANYYDGSTYCALAGGVNIVGLGDGSKTNATTRDGENCGTAGTGLNPSVDTTDSYDNEFGALFKNYDQELGAGGKLYSDQNFDTDIPAGMGASLEMIIGDQTVGQVGDGGPGLVVFRWTVDGGSSLANTGADSTQLSALAGGSLLLGAGLMVAGAVRRRSNSL